MVLVTKKTLPKISDCSFNVLLCANWVLAPTEPVSKDTDFLDAVHHGKAWKKGMASNQLRACCLVHMVHVEIQERSKCYFDSQRIIQMNIAISCECVWGCTMLRAKYFVPRRNPVQTLPLACVCVFVCVQLHSLFPRQSTISQMALEESISDRLQHGVQMLYTLSMRRAGDECLRRLPPMVWWSILMC